MIDSLSEVTKQVANSPVGWGGALIGIAASVRIIWPIVDKIAPIVALIFGKSNKKDEPEYMTKEEHERICSLNTQQIEELQDNRREVWKKIDQIYEWMATGIIQINRKDK